MTAKTYTIHGLPELPEGYGPDLHFCIPLKEAYILSPSQGWVQVDPRSQYSFPHLIVLPATPWYPDSWYDEHGNLLPDVYEHTPGTWPQHCKPADEIEILLLHERQFKTYGFQSTKATFTAWTDSETVSAYRVIERA